MPEVLAHLFITSLLGIASPPEEVTLRSDEETVIADIADIADDELHELLDALARELGLLRKTVLRHGHAQELFQARVEAAIGQLSGAATPPAAPPPLSFPNAAQVRTLVELDQAILQLLRLAAGGVGAAADAEETAPRSLGEGLSFLHVRVRNLQHSLGLEAIPTHNQFFDDRWHEACGVAHRPDLPDGWVVEEILPGYRLGERVVRPARVVVNRRERREEHHA
jgi:hypothetical protein